VFSTYVSTYAGVDPEPCQGNTTVALIPLFDSQIE